MYMKYRTYWKNPTVKNKIKRHQADMFFLFKKESNDTCYREVKQNGKTKLNQL